jgi:hypothetical protein
MTFNYANAIQLQHHYQFLKGKTFDINGKPYSIDLVTIAPTDKDLFGKFFNHYTQTGLDNMRSLVAIGFDANNVQVLLINDDSWSNIQIYAELDRYLTKYNIKKAYDNAGSFIA